MEKLKVYIIKLWVDYFKWRAVDIDHEEDFEMAELLYNIQKRG